MKRSTLLAALVLVPAMGFAAEGDQVAPVVSQEGGPKILSFEVGTAFQFTRKPFKNGQGYNFAINIPTKSVILGYYYEQVGAQAESNENNDATSTKVDATATVHLIRAIKLIPNTKDTLGIGLGVGMGDFTSKISGAAQTTQQQANVADLFIKWSPLSGGDSVKAALNVVAGYRFMRFSGVDLDGAGTDYTETTNNLDGLRLGLTVEFGF